MNVCCPRLIIHTSKGKNKRVKIVSKETSKISEALCVAHISTELIFEQMSKLRELAMKNPGSDFTARARHYSYDLQQLEREIGRVIHIGASSSAPVPTTPEGWAVWLGEFNF